MLHIHQVDTRAKADVRRFLQLPFSLYRDHPLWVPPILMDAATQLNREAHPFYERSEADFFLASRDGRDVGRIAVLEHKPYNEHHALRRAQFYLFECEDDFEAARALFERAFEWARARRLNQIVGPKGFGPLDGHGLLVDGYEFRPAMTMMTYNPPFYVDFVTRMGFAKEVDFVSAYMAAERFRLPERIHRIASRAAARSGLEVQRFRSKKELRAWVPKIGATYNQAFVDNWEYYPLSERELEFVIDAVMALANPRLIKIITHGGEMVGFLFAFPDVSAAIRRSKGRLFPFGLLDLLLEFRRTDWVVVNGAGVLPEFQGRGGNALLYSEMEKSVRESGFSHADLAQIAETAVQMRRDLETIGGVPYKNHRVYVRDL